MQVNQRCPRRDRDPLFSEVPGQPDHWRQLPNGDRTCSFCGSLHPEDFERLVQEAAKNDTNVRLEMSDKPYKIYVRQSGVSNASEGGIKFYLHHVPDEALRQRLTCAYNEAMGKARNRLNQSTQP